MNIRELRDYLRLVDTLNPRPYLLFDPTRAADCGVATQVRDLIASNFSCAEASCWQGSHPDFEVTEIPEGKTPPPW